MGTTVAFKRPDGQTVQGYLAEPQRAAGASAIVVIQEWWGLNAQIRAVADRLASAGYIALAPDLYRGKLTVEAEEAHHLMTALNFGDAASQDVRGAVQFLKTRCAKVGVSGFCMGGALTLLSLGAAPEIDAAVVWYGVPPLEYIDATRIKVPLQAHWAVQDQFFPIATVDQLQDKLREAGVDFDFHRYLAHHAFANETAVGPGRIPATQFDPVWSQQAWDRSFRFFGPATPALFPDCCAVARNSPDPANGAGRRSSGVPVIHFLHVANVPAEQVVLQVKPVLHHLHADQ